jgi:hypothetical protein
VDNFLVKTAFVKAENRLRSLQNNKNCHNRNMSNDEHREVTTKTLLIMVVTAALVGAGMVYFLLTVNTDSRRDYPEETAKQQTAKKSTSFSSSTAKAELLPNFSDLQSFNESISTSSLPLPENQSDLPQTIFPGRQEPNDSYKKRSKVILLRVGTNTPYDDVRLAVADINGGIVSFIPNATYKDDNTSTPGGPSDIYQIIFPENTSHFNAVERLEGYRFVRDVNWEYVGISKQEPVEDSREAYLDTPYQFIGRSTGTTTDVLKYAPDDGELSVMVESVDRTLDDQTIYLPGYNRLAVVDEKNRFRTYDTNTDGLMFSKKLADDNFSFSRLLPSPHLDEFILSFEQWQGQGESALYKSLHKWFSFPKSGTDGGLRSEKSLFATRWTLNDTYYFGSARGVDCGYDPNTHKYDQADNSLVEISKSDQADETTYVISPNGGYAVELFPAENLRDSGLSCSAPRTKFTITDSGKQIISRKAPEKTVYEPLGWSKDSSWFVLRRISYDAAPEGFCVRKTLPKKTTWPSAQSLRPFISTKQAGSWLT